MNAGRLIWRPEAQGVGQQDPGKCCWEIHGKCQDWPPKPGYGPPCKKRTSVSSACGGRARACSDGIGYSKQTSRPVPHCSCMHTHAHTATAWRGMKFAPIKLTKEAWPLPVRSTLRPPRSAGRAMPARVEAAQRPTPFPQAAHLLDPPFCLGSAYAARRAMGSAIACSQRPVLMG